MHTLNLYQHILIGFYLSYLKRSIKDYFKDNPEVDSSHVSEFLLDNRPIKENSVLVIKQNK